LYRSCCYAPFGFFALDIRFRDGKIKPDPPPSTIVSDDPTAGATCRQIFLIDRCDNSCLLNIVTRRFGSNGQHLRRTTSAVTAVKISDGGSLDREGCPIRAALLLVCEKVSVCMFEMGRT